MNDALSFAVSALTCSVGEHRLFSGLSLRLERGDGLVVTGPNGSGKTTLLRTLAGLRKPDAGTVSFNGLGSDTPSQQATHYIGHRDGLRSALTVRENLAFAASTMGTGVTVVKAAERLLLTRLLELPAGVLSAGQRRRAALARLLVCNRPLWLLDEPTAALDTASHSIVETLIADHLASGGMAIAATHLPLAGAPMRSLAFRSDGTFQFDGGNQ